MSTKESLNDSNWVPSIDATSEMIGVVLLFVPYAMILLPFMQTYIVQHLQKLYIHQTPRDDWNAAVDQHPPRRVLGYLFSILFSFLSVAFILMENHYNNLWLDIFQYFIYLSLPLILSIIRPPSRRPGDSMDILIILLVIIPIELSEKFDSFLPDIRFRIYDSWNRSPNISTLRMSGFNLFLFIFFIFRPLSHIGLGWDVTHRQRQRIKWIVLQFIVIMALFLMIGIPFCVIPGIEYLHSPHKLGNIWIDGIARFFSFFFLNTLILEFLYRGVIQNLFHSALDFHHEARQYIRGGPDSIQDILSQFDESPVIGVLSAPSSNNHQLTGSPLSALGVVPQHNKLPIDSSKSINSIHSINSFASPKHHRLDDTVDLESLPYFDGQYGDMDSPILGGIRRGRGIPYIATHRDSVRQCFCVRFEHPRDWTVVALSSVLYAVTVIDYKNFEKGRDLVFGAMFMFWLGMCCGWLFRLTNSCFISAIFNTLIMFNFKYIFNPDTRFCNGAC